MFRIAFYRLLMILVVYPAGLFCQDLPPLSVGLSAGGSGVFGSTIRYQPHERYAFELGIYARTALVDVFEKHWYFGPGIDIGMNYYFRTRGDMEVVRRSSHGLFIKGGFGIWKLEEALSSLGWVMEIPNRNKPKRFMQIQLGPAVRHRVETYLNTRYPPGYQEMSESWYSGMIYTRLSWFF